MSGTLIQVNVDGNNVVGVGKNKEHARKDLYKNLYKIYEDKKVEEVSFQIRNGQTQVVNNVSKCVLFYAAYSYNGENITEKHVRKLEKDLNNTNLDEHWGENWKQKLKEDKL